MCVCVYWPATSRERKEESARHMKEHEWTNVSKGCRYRDPKVHKSLLEWDARSVC